MSDNNQPKFTLLRGGLSETAADSQKVFLSAYVTDTRLMGVIGVYIHWSLPENINMTDFHQFFYFDAEEFGFDTYKGLLTGSDGEGTEELKNIEDSLLGGLGGQQIPLTEKEARYLVQEYANLNIREGLALPEGQEEYDFLFHPTVQLDDEEILILMSKQCPVLESPYQVTNYFLMRCFGHDFGAAKFLTKNYVRTNLFPEHKGATLFKNTIDPAPMPGVDTNTAYYVTDSDKDFGTFSTHKTYLCESLIGYDEEYHIVITQVTLDHLRVVKFERVSTFKITPAEATMMLRKPEYITVFDIVDGAPIFTHNTTHLSKRAMITIHEAGKLFMIFNPHNHHVNKQTFVLNDDVLGVYYVSDSDQLILSSFSSEGIRTLESDFFRSGYGMYTSLVSKYQFKEPVLYDYICSDFDDFEDFVDFIADETFLNNNPEY